MGGEEEIVKIARRLDKMVAKKSAVSGGGWPPASPQPPPFLPPLGACAGFGAGGGCPEGPGAVPVPVVCLRAAPRPQQPRPRWVLGALSALRALG